CGVLRVAARHQARQQPAPGPEQQRRGGGALVLGAEGRDGQQQTGDADGGRDGGDVAGGLVHLPSASSASRSPSRVFATSQSASGLIRGGIRTATVPPGPFAPPPTCSPSGSPRFVPGVPVRRRSVSAMRVDGAIRSPSVARRRTRTRSRGRGAAGT